MHVDHDMKFEAEGPDSAKVVGQYALERSREREKTKRLLIAVVAGLVALATICFLFAPAGKEKMGMIIGSILAVLALGAIGASNFIIKGFGVHIQSESLMHSEIKVSPPQAPGKGKKQNKETTHVTPRA
jgi:hypothetical protein